MWLGHRLGWWSVFLCFLRRSGCSSLLLRRRPLLLNFLARLRLRLRSNLPWLTGRFRPRHDLPLTRLRTF